MTSDLAALSASVYMRGCSLVLVPTTLLAMVDAALVGKTKDKGVPDADLLLYDSPPRMSARSQKNK